ncbi:TPA: hypothetical protein U0S23_004770 [Escherichia coli]|nr:hypothetical protein [Escherichia coli]HEM0087237.1 hypothetical protein [Escherichia coli]
MNKIALVPLIALLLIGCSSPKPVRTDNKVYEHFKECNLLNLEKPELPVSKEDFLKLLYGGESIIMTTQTVTSWKEEDLFRFGLGWRSDLNMAISNCKINQMKIVLNAVKGPFENIKYNTKNKTEKEALVSAYSAWENYVKSPSKETKIIFEEKASYYKNI